MNEMKNYKCPNCGGDIEFDSATQGMKCPYCDSEFKISDLAAYDQEVKEDRKDDMNWTEYSVNEWNSGETEGMNVYVCKSCGGELVADENTGMTSCPYCGNPIVMRERFSGKFKPDFVIPFQLDKKKAMDAFEEHLKGKKLLSKSFASSNHLQEIKGVYVPYWVFDADVEADFRYKATKVKHWSDDNYDYTETSTYSVTRSGGIAFDNVPVDASTKMPDDLTDALEPFDFKAAKPFTTAYLSGYMADKFDVDKDTNMKKANERIKKSTSEHFYETVTGYNSVDEEHSSIRFKKTKAKYCLFPVWLMHITWNNEDFLFAMNGQTGKFVGDLPMDNSAYKKYFARNFIISFVICLLIAFIFFNGG